MRRRILLLVLAMVCMAIPSRAQVAGWPQRSFHEQFSTDSTYRNLTIDKSVYSWRPFGREVGYAIYGSRYRKAVSNKGWGITLCIMAPVLGLATGGALDSGCRTWVVVTGGALVCGGALGAGIPLWVKGQKELDAMLDDYVKNYGPKPHASRSGAGSHSANLTAGPTRSGLGPALNF
jgi:hypothetical protein